MLEFHCIFSAFGVFVVSDAFSIAVESTPLTGTTDAEQSILSNSNYFQSTVWSTWSPIITAKLTNSKIALSSTVSSAQSDTSQTAIGQTNSKTATATVQSLLSIIVGLSSTPVRLTTSNTATPQTTSRQTISKTATLQQILLTTRLTTSRTALPTNPSVVPPPTMVSGSWPCDSVLGTCAPSNCPVCYLE